MSLVFDNLDYAYPEISAPALQNVSGSIERGKITALIGSSGSGKSTLAMILKGLITKDSGSIYKASIDGVKSDISAQYLLKHVGWTPANPEIQLFASTINEEVAFGPSNLGITGDELTEKVKSALEAVGLDYDRFKSRHPLFLSGGEKRLAALAGVVAMGFRWYILDEPSAGLDYRGWKSVCGLVKDLALSGAGVCWISHDLSSLKGISDRVIELKEGKLEYSGAAVDFDWDASLKRMVLS